jgi:DNA topoisomerase-1
MPTTGIFRKRSGRGFRYVRESGNAVKMPAILERIRLLAIPPAWEDVWISADDSSPLQATGRDQRGRKQYKYHAKWRERRERAKFSRLRRFPQILIKVRRALRRDAARKVGSRRQVLATVVRLLEETLIRVGNAEYARHNASYGLTTLQNKHASVAGDELQFNFNGKGGKPHEVVVVDKRMARTIRRCQKMPGELFAWVDANGRAHDVTSADVNEYLREISGEDITAKDFRTWAGSLLAVRYFRQSSPLGAATRREVMAVVRRVAEELRNTPAVCRQSYIHPSVIAAFQRPSLRERARRRRTPAKLSDEQFLCRLIS